MGLQMFGSLSGGGAPVVALLRLTGVIGDRGGMLRRGELSLAGMERTLERAFTLKRLRAIALQINSPGGSPVQSALNRCTSE